MGQAIEDAVIELDKCNGGGAEEEVFVDAVVGQERADARRVARVERGVQPADRARGARHPGPAPLFVFLPGRPREERARRAMHPGPAPLLVFLPRV